MNRPFKRFFLTFLLVALSISIAPIPVSASSAGGTESAKGMAFQDAIASLHCL